VLIIAVAWDLLGNLVLPGDWYVPANLAVAGLLIAIGRGAGLRWADLGMDRADVRRGFRYGLASVLIIAAVLAIALLVPTTRARLADGIEPETALTQWFVMLVRIPFGTAVFEEVLFRGVLFGLLTRLRDQRTALVATAILFGFWHVVPAWEASSGTGPAIAASIIGTVLVTTFAGAVFGWLRLRSRSVVAPIFAHTATNSLAYAAAIVALHLTS
jgi:membrane protease YdiL (CAAX protease family)